MKFNEIYKNAKASLKIENNDEVYLYINNVKENKIFTEIEFDVLTDELIAYDKFLIENRFDINKSYEDNPMIFFFGEGKIKTSKARLLGLEKHTLYLAKVHNFRNDYMLDASIHFSTSPLRKTSYGIEIIGSAVNTIFLNKSIIDNHVVFNYSVPNIIPYKVRGYNVGQGNFSAIFYDQQNQYFLYDVGFTKLTHEKDIYIKVINEIKKLKPNYVILSHFDLDHILGSIYLDDFVFSKCWVVPKQDNYSVSALRLMACVQALKGQITTIDNNTIIQNNRNVILNKCDGKDANNGGIIIKLINNKEALLLGDVDYSSIPATLNNTKVDFLFVPHHGSGTLKNKVTISGKDKSIALISTGKNPYGHPSSSHMDKLETKGFEIILTISKIFYDYDL